MSEIRVAGPNLEEKRTAGGAGIRRVTSGITAVQFQGLTCALRLYKRFTFGKADRRAYGYSLLFLPLFCNSEITFHNEKLKDNDLRPQDSCNISCNTIIIMTSRKQVEYPIMMAT